MSNIQDKSSKPQPTPGEWKSDDVIGVEIAETERRDPDEAVEHGERFDGQS